MDSWWIFIFLLSLILLFLLKLLLSISHNTRPKLPPGPSFVRFITMSWRAKNVIGLELVLRNLHAKYGPILSLSIASKIEIYISDRNIAHHVLVHHGAIFADRMPINQLSRLISNGRETIASSPYGPLWRLLRRNLTSNILHSSRINHFVNARKWVLQILIDELKSQAKSNEGVVVAMESFRFAMFCLLAHKCFGEKLNLDKFREVESAQKSLYRSFTEFAVFSIFPKITKLVFRKKWETLVEIQRKHEEVYIPLIRARAREASKGNERLFCSYVDSLLELSIPEEGGRERQLTEVEMVNLCTEFLSAGIDTTSTALEWTMAELVKNQGMQKTVVEEIEETLRPEDEIKEADLQKMPYLKAVILEGLRRHPPTHFVVPHRVTEEIVIGGYAIPRKASVNFMVAEMGWDEIVWKAPMEFRPERFLVGGEGEGVDITGSREIKMMPFGVGRRICPGLGLALLHLEYFVASLVREFKWEVVEGENVDLSERLELSVVMKNHLRARISPRRGDEKMMIASNVQ